MKHFNENCYYIVSDWVNKNENKIIVILNQITIIIDVKFDEK